VKNSVVMNKSAVSVRVNKASAAASKYVFVVADGLDAPTHADELRCVVVKVACRCCQKTATF